MKALLPGTVGSPGPSFLLPPRYHPFTLQIPGTCFRYRLALRRYGAKENESGPASCAGRTSRSDEQGATTTGPHRPPCLGSTRACRRGAPARRDSRSSVESISWKPISFQRRTIKTPSSAARGPFAPRARPPPPDTGPSSAYEMRLRVTASVRFRDRLAAHVLSEENNILPIPATGDGGGDAYSFLVSLGTDSMDSRAWREISYARLSQSEEQKTIVCACPPTDAAAAGRWLGVLSALPPSSSASSASPCPHRPPLFHSPRRACPSRRASTASGRVDRWIFQDHALQWCSRTDRRTFCEGESHDGRPEASPEPGSAVS